MIQVTRKRYFSVSVLAVLVLALSGCGDDESSDNLAPAGSSAQCPARCSPDGRCPSDFECWADPNSHEFLCCDERPTTSFLPVLPVGANARCIPDPCSLEDASCPDGFECWANPVEP